MITLDAHANMRSYETSTMETGCGARGSARSRGSALRDGARGGTSDRTRQADQRGAGGEVPAADREGEPREYDAWALRWLARSASEAGAVTIEQAAEIAASLADLPAEPTALLEHL